MPESKETLMKEMRAEFIPRESLEIKFHHINGSLNKLQLAIDTLPSQVAKEFSERLESRFLKLEERQLKVDERIERTEENIAKINLFLARMLGGLVVLQVFLKYFADFIFKK